MRLLAPLALLVLVGCAGPGTSSPDLTDGGTVLTYEVVAGPQTYPFVVTITENGPEGTAFAYNLGEGAQIGTVRMTPEARQSAPRGMQNRFGSDDYVLTDQTSVWMARDDVRRLKAGETVEINLGFGPHAFALDACGVPFEAGDETVMTCRYTSPDALIVALDDPTEPLILDMDAPQFRVTLQSVGR